MTLEETAMWQAKEDVNEARGVLKALLRDRAGGSVRFSEDVRERIGAAFDLLTKAGRNLGMYDDV